MSKIVLSIVQTEILKELAKYEYLTAEQLERLLNSHRTYINEHMRRFENRPKPFIKSVNFVKETRRQLPKVYYLTQIGVAYLVEAEDYNVEDIKRPMTKFSPSPLRLKKVISDVDLEIEKDLEK